MSGDFSGDDLAFSAAKLVIKLAVSDGWKAAKQLIKDLRSKRTTKGSSGSTLAIPKPAGDLDGSFTEQVADYLRSDPHLLEALTAHFGRQNLSAVQVTVGDHAQAAVQGTGTQNNTFRTK